MQKTRRELLDDFLLFVGEPEDDDARNVAERLLNLSLTSIWLKQPWRHFRSPVPFQITLTASQARYSLPDYFGRVGPGEMRNVTKARPVRQVPEGQVDRLFPNAGTSYEIAGEVSHFEILGVSGVHTQPAVAGDELEVVSSSADDTDVVVAIAGDDSSGRWTRNQVTLNGTTAVPIGTWSFVDELGKAYRASATPATELTSSRGTITLRKTSGQAELQKLFAQESAKEHQILRVYPKPSAADVLALPIIRKPKRLFNDADVLPDLWEPAVWEELLLNWQVNRGELTQADAMQAPRPAYIDLLAFENATKARPQATGYRGIR